MALGMEVGLGSCYIVQDGDPAPSPKLGQILQFLAHFYCAQKARCIKMPLGKYVGLSPGDFVFDGDPAPSPKGTEPPIFGPRLLWPNGCMDWDASCYRGSPWAT